MRRFAWAGIFALISACLAFLFAVPASGYYRHAPIDEAASWLAQRKVNVRCLTPRETEQDAITSFWGASAYVEGWIDAHGRWHPYDYTVFAYGHCGPLLGLLRGDWLDYSVEDVAWALLVLTHESGHLRGHRWSEDEALTQRWALRHFVYVAMHFGASEQQARALLWFAVRFHMKMPEEYRVEGCDKPWVDDSGLLRDCKVR